MHILCLFSSSSLLSARNKPEKNGEQQQIKIISRNTLDLLSIRKKERRRSRSKMLESISLDFKEFNRLSALNVKINY